MNSIAQDFVARLGRVRYINREVNDLRMEVGKWSIENAAMLVFDKRLKCLEEATEGEEFGRQMVEANAEIFKVFVQPRLFQLFSIEFYIFFYCLTVQFRNIK